MNTLSECTLFNISKNITSYNLLIVFDLDSRFRVVSENHQYKYSLPPDMAQYTNVNFDTYIKEADLIKAALIKNPVPENINPVKTLDERYP